MEPFRPVSGEPPTSGQTWQHLEALSLAAPICFSCPRFVYGDEHGGWCLEYDHPTRPDAIVCTACPGRR